MYVLSRLNYQNYLNKPITPIQSYHFLEKGFTLKKEDKKSTKGRVYKRPSDCYFSSFSPYRPIHQAFVVSCNKKSVELNVNFFGIIKTKYI